MRSVRSTLMPLITNRRTRANSVPSLLRGKKYEQNCDCGANFMIKGWLLDQDRATHVSDCCVKQSEILHRYTGLDLLLVRRNRFSAG
jgi:hypothetical protein